MLFENEINLSQQLKKKNILPEHLKQNGAFFLIKKKKENKSDSHNRSIEFFGKSKNLFNKLEKLIEKNNIIKNSEKKFIKRPFNQFFENESTKNLFPRIKLLENILLNKRPNITKEKSRVHSLNSKSIKLSKIISKSNLLINDSSTNDLLFDGNNINIFKAKNELLEGGKTGSHASNTLSQDKLDQINMNKTALLRKIKFESLKKFCKNVRLTDKKIGFNLNKENEQNNKNEVRKNNCEEIKISSIKEKVRNYFIGRFNNIKEYFENWDEKKLGKIDFKDIHQYINQKIKYKISESDIKRLLHLTCNKRYLDLENFRVIFFEKTPKDNLFVKGNQLLEHQEKLIKSLNEMNHANKKENNNCNISFFEKVKLNEYISLLLKHKNSILSQINTDKVELTFIEFYSIIKSTIDDRKYNYDKEIKRLFNDYKVKDIDLINIYNFFEKINIKKEENSKENANSHPIKNIRNHINPGMRSCITKNQKPRIMLNSRNIKNKNFDYKDTHQSKTNSALDKATNKEIESNKNININGLNNLNKLKNIRINFVKEKKRQIRNSFNSKFSRANYFIDYSLNNNKKLANENIENSKIIDSPLPKIKNFKKTKNKNSDIIDIL